MQNRSIAAAAVLILVAGTAACGDEQKPEQAKNAQITVGGKTQTTRDVSCTQVNWSMTIETKSGRTGTRSFLEIGGDQPVAKTVDIRDFDGFSGVAGEGAGGVEVSFANNSYIIEGTAEGSDPERPGMTKTVPFRIETPC